MAVLTLTGNAWDHNRMVVPAGLRPVLGFRPVRAGNTAGLMTTREVWAALNLASGEFSVDLEQGMSYVPFMEWSVSESQASEMSPNRARGRCEWPAFTAWVSGPIDAQPPANGGLTTLWWVSLSDPPAGFKGKWLVSDPSVTPTNTNPTIGEVRRVY